MVLWDAPGCGKSRPPDRDVSPGLFNRDADHAIALMEVGTRLYYEYKYLLYRIFSNSLHTNVFD